MNTSNSRSMCCKRSNSSTTPSFLIVFDIFLHYGILLNGSVDLTRALLSLQRTKALSDLTAKLGPNVDGAACVFGLSRNAYQRHFRG